MNTRNAIIQLLHAGHSDKAIARELHIRSSRIADIRRQIGLPAHKPGPTGATSYEELFWRRAIPTDDGHLIWPNTTTAIRIAHEGTKRSAYRIAFSLAHAREPVGHVMTGCGITGCVHPRHVEDQQIRDNYQAIFGNQAA